jgi:hypothetical protein
LGNFLKFLDREIEKSWKGNLGILREYDDVEG